MGGAAPPAPLLGKIGDACGRPDWPSTDVRRATCSSGPPLGPEVFVYNSIVVSPTQGCHPDNGSAYGRRVIRLWPVVSKGRYTFSVEQPELEDLTNISFDEFVSLIFERATPPETEVDLSHHYVEVKLNAKKICAYYVRLFRRPEFVLSQFTKQQLERGFWEIMGHTHEWSAGNIIDFSDAPLSSRAACIDSMASLFERLFANEPLDTSVQMWWDSLCYGWHCDNRSRERGGEDLELQDIFFRTLAKVLAIDSWICQGAALHGLGHLHHPQTGDLVHRYIDEHPSLTTEQREYALAAAKFKVL